MFQSHDAFLQDIQRHRTVVANDCDRRLQHPTHPSPSAVKCIGSLVEFVSSACLENRYRPRRQRKGKKESQPFRSVSFWCNFFHAGRAPVQTPCRLSAFGGDSCQPAGQIGAPQNHPSVHSTTSPVLTPPTTCDLLSFVCSLPLHFGSQIQKHDHRQEIR